jgi:hypothetical protein
VGTIWLYVVMQFGGEPMIDGEYHSYSSCIERLGQGQPELEHERAIWISGCVAVKYQAFTYARAHR